MQQTRYFEQVESWLLQALTGFGHVSRGPVRSCNLIRQPNVAILFSDSSSVNRFGKHDVSQRTLARGGCF
jgi:hypothetical protein